MPISDPTTPNRRSINGAILRLSLPAVLSNIALPLLGLCDTYITGHLGAEKYLAAIAVGSVMVNSTYWLFGFLRAGTSGMTAEAFGRGDSDLQRNIFTVSLMLGLALGMAVIAMAWPLSEALLEVVDAPEGTASLARRYFIISTLSAPALLGTMSVSGWMIGRQNTVYPMAIAIAVNVINIALSFTFVYLFRMGFTGVAAGTATANWLGLGIALMLARRLRQGRLFARLRGLWSKVDWRRFSGVNGNLLLRSGCIMAVTYGMTGFAARLGGDGALAANAVMMQLFLFFSFFMDGYAYAAEALCGRWSGAGNRAMLRRSIVWLGVWGAVTALLFAAAYAFGAREIAGMLTDVPAVKEQIGEMAWICAAIPLCSGGAFLLDGVYIGLTATGKMLAATAAGAALFFAGAWLCTARATANAYTMLWCAFLGFLMIRSVMLTLSLGRILRKNKTTAPENESGR